MGNDYCAGLNQQLYMKQYCGSKTIVDFSFQQPVCACQIPQNGQVIIYCKNGDVWQLNNTFSAIRQIANIKNKVGEIRQLVFNNFDARKTENAVELFAVDTKYACIWRLTLAFD